MKALILGEGEHELGGALTALVERLAARQYEYETDCVSRKDIHAHHGKGQGFFKRAVRWMWEARKQGYSALILLVDEDGHAQRMKEIDRAQGYEKVSMRRALGVAIRTFDAWMLADEQALSAVLGIGVQRKAGPETIADPKGICEELLAGGNKGMTQREMYHEVARVAEIGTLEDRCPRGFAPFAGRVRRL